MKHFLVAGLVLFFGGMAQARFTPYKDPKQMISTADAIAVVEIVRIEKVSIKGATSAYGQKSSAKVQHVLKGKLGKNILIYGAERFGCDRSHFEKGKYLVFLDNNKHLLTGNNWRFSDRKITGDKVDWFDNGDIISTRQASLRSVLNEIKSFLKRR